MTIPRCFMLGWLGLWLAVPAGASDILSDRVIHFEETPFKDAEMFCEEEKEIVPKDNDFEIRHYAFMGSERGDRYALITLHNTSSGQRLLEKEDLVATLANCRRLYPVSLEKQFSGGETFTLEVNFGVHRFPIVNVYNKRP